MRQYCSGGSRIWSSIHPLPGVCSSGWLRKNRKRPPGREHAATSAMADVDVDDVLEHQARDRPRRTLRPANGSAAASAARVDAARRARRVASAICADGRVDADDARRHPRAARRARSGPRRMPTSSTAPRAGEVSAASGRICSSYSGSAPSVNPSCHQLACASHRSRSVIVHPQHAPRGRHARRTCRGRAGGAWSCS